MKHALISPNEPRYTGVRIAEVSSSTFEVASPLFWVEVVDAVTAEHYFYDIQTRQPVLSPLPPVPEDQPVGNGVQQA